MPGILYLPVASDPSTLYTPTQTEALVRGLLRRAEDELHDCDPALDKDDDADAAGAPAGAGAEGEVLDEEARFWAQYRAQQRAAALQAQRQERAYRREWSSANGFCHLRVVGVGIVGGKPAAAAQDEQGHHQPQRQRARRRAAGPGWEWHAPLRRTDDAGESMDEAASDEDAEHPSGTARCFFEAPPAAVVGRKARVRLRGGVPEGQGLQPEGEEEVFAR